jgi:hypothetical protein
MFEFAYKVLIIFYIIVLVTYLTALALNLSSSPISRVERISDKVLNTIYDNLFLISVPALIYILTILLIKIF